MLHWVNQMKGNIRLCPLYGQWYMILSQTVAIKLETQNCLESPEIGPSIEPKPVPAWWCLWVQSEFYRWFFKLGWVVACTQSWPQTPWLLLGWIRMLTVCQALMLPNIVDTNAVVAEWAQIPKPNSEISWKAFLEAWTVGDYFWNGVYVWMWLVKCPLMFWCIGYTTLDPWRKISRCTIWHNSQIVIAQWKEKAKLKGDWWSEARAGMQGARPYL